MKSTSLSIIPLLILLTLTTYSQSNLSLSTSNGYSNSSIYGSSNLSTPLSLNSLDYSYNHVGSKVSLFAGGGIMQYFNFDDRSYATGYAGTGYSSYLDTSESASVNLYGSFLLRKALISNDYSDSYQLMTGSQYVNALSETSVLYIGTDFKYKIFDFVSELNFVENSTGISLSKSFETKTSIKTSVSLDTKLYNSNISSDTSQISNSGRMKSKLNTLSSQFKYTAIVAQNIFENTGVSISYDGSISLNEYNTPIEYIGFDFAGDNEFFDDPYSFIQSQFAIRLTQMLPWDIKSSISYSFAQKNYNYEVLVNELTDEYTDRNDEMSSFELSIQKKVNFDNSFLNGINLRLDYEIYNNISNYNYMNYKGSYIILGVELGL